jgi:hypothetical protein
MRDHTRRWAVITIAAVIAAGSASAHDRKTAGPLQLTIGWGDEPAFTGSRNSVIVSLSDAAGPLKQAPATLSVEISFGSERITLPLEPALGRPHEFHAWLVPTRAGTYTFHITGKVRAQNIDVTTTCGEKTFHCVVEASEIQFPAKDPSAGQLAERMDRALPRADRATAAAWRAQWLAIAALVISMAAAGLGMRRGR